MGAFQTGFQSGQSIVQQAIENAQKDKEIAQRDRALESELATAALTRREIQQRLGQADQVDSAISRLNQLSGPDGSVVTNQQAITGLTGMNQGQINSALVSGGPTGLQKTIDGLTKPDMSDLQGAPLTNVTGQTAPITPPTGLQVESRKANQGDILRAQIQLANLRGQDASGLYDKLNKYDYNETWGKKVTDNLNYVKENPAAAYKLAADITGSTALPITVQGIDPKTGAFSLSIKSNDGKNTDILLTRQQMAETLAHHEMMSDPRFTDIAHAGIDSIHGKLAEVVKAFNEANLHGAQVGNQGISAAASRTSANASMIKARADEKQSGAVANFYNEKTEDAKGQRKRLEEAAAIEEKFNALPPDKQVGPIGKGLAAQYAMKIGKLPNTLGSSASNAKYELNNQANALAAKVLESDPNPVKAKAARDSFLAMNGVAPDDAVNEILSGISQGGDDKGKPLTTDHLVKFAQMYPTTWASDGPRIQEAWQQRINDAKSKSAPTTGLPPPNVSNGLVLPSNRFDKNLPGGAFLNYLDARGLVPSQAQPIQNIPFDAGKANHPYAMPWER